MSGCQLSEAILVWVAVVLVAIVWVAVVLVADVLVAIVWVAVVLDAVVLVAIVLDPYYHPLSLLLRACLSLSHISHTDFPF